MLLHTTFEIAIFLFAFQFSRVSSQKRAALPPLWDVLLHVSDNEEVAAVVAMILDPRLTQAKDAENWISSREEESSIGDSEDRDFQPYDLGTYYPQEDNKGYRVEEKSIPSVPRDFEERSARPKLREETSRSEEDERPAWGETPLVGEENPGDRRLRENHEKTNEDEPRFQGEISQRMDQGIERHTEDISNRKGEGGADERPVWGETPVVSNEEQRIRFGIVQTGEKKNHGEEKVRNEEDYLGRRISMNQGSVQSRVEETVGDMMNEETVGDMMNEETVGDTMNEEEVDERPAWGETPLEKNETTKS